MFLGIDAASLGLIRQLGDEFQRLRIDHRWIEPLTGLIGRTVSDPNEAMCREVSVGEVADASAIFDDDALACGAHLCAARSQHSTVDATIDYFIFVSDGTYAPLDECGIIGIRRSNGRALWALERDDTDAVYACADHNERVSVRWPPAD